jgi:N-sulfoglucosamine sulfohydrolase
MKWTTLVLALLTPLAFGRPNILWITSEDNSPLLGCYGDALAQTPRLDQMAQEGIRYLNAFANAPVCSTARTTLITGMHATSLGAHHHRSSVAIPEDFQFYPQHLRRAGYYCTNSSKTDYNIAGKRQVWDESGNDAHYKNRKDADQPFFAVFNLMATHESKVAPPKGRDSFRIPPQEFPLPPYLPDTPEIRRDAANYYEQMTLMDRQVGRLLDELEQAGLAENTIVFYYGDHGGALPRGKRNIHDSGTRVPLIIRFPEKWAALSPAPAGSSIDAPVSFVDFPATVFSLCGVPLPEHYQGRAFLGENKATPRDHVFLFRDRMDERYDNIRAIRDKQFRYVRNYSPHRPWGQHYSYPFEVLPSMRSWHAEFKAGRCNEIQAAYWLPKPGEEFYQIANDPHEIRNLVADPSHADQVSRLRAALREEILTTRDAGFIPEGMAAALAAERTVYEYARSDDYPLERIVTLADLASEGDPAHLPELISALEDPHPVIRYWAATGCLILGQKASPAKAALLQTLADQWADTRLVAAEALAHLGETLAAAKAVTAVLDQGNPHEILAAQNTLDFMRQAGFVPLAVAQDMIRDFKGSEPNNRIPRHLLSQ